MIQFDVIVVGGGHAGCEAAAAAARVGARTALVTADLATIGAMSCNPSIGGVGKGHLVREIDALGGIMAQAADRSCLHRRMLNASKGVAVRGPRMQADRTLYRAAVRDLLAEQPLLTIIEGRADGLLGADARVDGVRLDDGSALRAAAIVVAAGTFLRSRMFAGERISSGGRVGEHDAIMLADALKDRGVPIARMKTGTPPRLDGRTIDWARLDRQASDAAPWMMSSCAPSASPPVLACWQTRTNPRTHEIIRRSLSRSPLHSGAITAGGPRYCPSIEDKVARFGDRDGHLIFLEPECLDSKLVYPNGISTSLPPEIQREFVRSIAGLERAEIAQPGYAVEYDHVDPRALDRSLAVRALTGLFLAGQVNGTTGYEEAAAQGLVAGLNAARHALGRPPIGFDREDSYIGVMVDDLVLQGVTEPYRMLTGRAEHRLRLRPDNAETRLGALAASCGLLDDRASIGRCSREALRRRVRDCLGELPSLAERIDYRLAERRTLGELANDGAFDPSSLLHLRTELAEVPAEIIGEVLADILYAPFLARLSRDDDRRKMDRAVPIPETLDYATVSGLSNEMRERLTAASPQTLADAARVRGITPAALAAVHVAIGKGR